jgi:hypothetical protein
VADRAAGADGRREPIILQSAHLSLAGSRHERPSLFVVDRQHFEITDLSRAIEGQRRRADSEVDAISAKFISILTFLAFSQ